MGKRNTLIGIKFGRLMPIAVSHKGHHGVYYKCKCDCGEETIVRSNYLTSGHTRSCGCLRIDMIQTKPII